MKDLLRDLENLFFFYLVFFPTLESLSINGEYTDTNNLVGKFKTSQNFLKENLVVCEITSEIISQEIIDKMRAINDLPVYSLQYLVSETYDHVIVNHKMTLLLHVVEGLYDKTA